MSAVTEKTETAKARSLVAAALAAAGLERVPAGWRERLESFTAAAALREISRPLAPFSLNRLLALVSPAASGLLEEMAQASQAVTRQRFGMVMNLYAPLYLSNHCVNRCAYCGFSAANRQAARRRLTVAEALTEARILAAEGFCDVLLVGGDDPAGVGMDYLLELLPRLRRLFSAIAIEIHTLGEEDYRRLFAAGVDGVTIYQETYDRDVYARVHLAGPKRDFDRRLRDQEAAARAGTRRLNLGALLGLSDWRFEAACLAVHGQVLRQHFWRTKMSFSFPRLRAAAGVDLKDFQPISDRALAQMVFALRLCFPDAGLVLSTRESPGLRDRLGPLGITQMSAGSKTNPGGYSDCERPTAGDAGPAARQFDVSDERPAAEIAARLKSRGYDPVWKDWDQGFADYAG